MQCQIPYIEKCDHLVYLLTLRSSLNILRAIATSIHDALMAHHARITNRPDKRLCTSVFVALIHYSIFFNIMKFADFVFTVG